MVESQGMEYNIWGFFFTYLLLLKQYFLVVMAELCNSIIVTT